MTTHKPKLSVVGVAPTEESGESEIHRPAVSTAPEATGGAGQPRLVWLLAALLLLLSGFLIAQVQRARNLDSRVQALTGELISAREDVVAQRNHLGVVQGEVSLLHSAASELERRLAALGELAGRDPLERESTT